MAKWFSPEPSFDQNLKSSCQIFFFVEIFYLGGLYGGHRSPVHCLIYRMLICPLLIKLFKENRLLSKSKIVNFVGFWAKTFIHNSSKLLSVILIFLYNWGKYMKLMQSTF